MLINIIQEFAQRMEGRLLEMRSKLTQQNDFAVIESELNQECAQLNAALQQAMLQELLREEVFLSMLKTYAGRCGMRLKAYRRLMLTLSNGQRIAIDSPYFIKAKRQERRQKRRPNGSGAHIGLKARVGCISDSVIHRFYS
ncbi:MAG: hypothetical protein SVR94_08330 [Pseudomonadota bacterium]|nr:hypothetical protein [Pseudomonadota bacterium]